MPLDPSIILNVKPPQIEPFQNVFLKAAEMQNLMSETALRGEQVRDAALKRQQSMQDDEDAKTIQQVYAQHIQGLKPGQAPDMQAVRNDVASRVRPATLEKFDKSVQEHAQAMAALDRDKVTTAKAMNDQLANHLGAVQAAKEADRPAAWRAQIAAAKAAGLPVDQLPAEYPGAETLDQYDIALRGSTAHLDDRAKQIGIEEKQQQIQTAKSTAAEAEAKTGAEKAKEAQAAKDRMRAEAANTHLDVTNQAEHGAWRAKLDPAIRDEYSLVFSPGSQKVIQQKGLTAEQRVQAADRATTAAQTAASDAERKRHDLADEAINRDKAAKTGEGKPLTPVQKSSIEGAKAKALSDSKSKLDKDLAAVTANGKVFDQEAADTAWQDHIERLRAAQEAYEQKLSAATGSDVGHNPWADNLRAPAASSARTPATPTPGTAPPAATPASARSGQPANSQSELASKYKPGQSVKLKDGRTVTIKKINQDGTFEY